MKKSLVLFFCMMVASAFAGVDSLRTCAQPSNGLAPDNMPWLPKNATQNACDQMMISSAQQVTSASDRSDHVVAFKDRKLAGMRDKNSRIGTPVLFDPAAWDESASVGLMGELWWGRIGDWHVFAGQESYFRLTKGTAMPSQNEMAQRLTELKRQMDALKNKQPPPAPRGPAVDESGLFVQKTSDYQQIGGTRMTFTGGSGGDGAIPPGTVSNAKLRLESSPVLRGMLSFDLDVDGKTRTFSVPVTRNMSKADNTSFPDVQQKYRLRGAAVINGDYYRCNERPNASKPGGGEACEFSDVPFKETYEAYGAFFGDHAGLAAIHVRLKVNSPVRNRYGTFASGIIVLRDVMAPSAPVASQESQRASSPAAPDAGMSDATLAHAMLARDDGSDAIPVKDCPISFQPLARPGPEPENSAICNSQDTPMAQVVEACSVSFQKKTDLCYMTNMYFKDARILLFTSTDAGCPVCLKANAVYHAFAKKHFLDERGKVFFMQFTWNPWNSAFAAPVHPRITSFNIQGLPTILALKDGKIVGRINGATSVSEIEKLLVRVKKD